MRALLAAVVIAAVLAPEPRSRDVVVQWSGPGCADTLRWHWGAGERDDETAIDNPEDDCLRSFTRRHAFKSSARRQVWVVFLRHDEEIGQSTPAWVSP